MPAHDIHFAVLRPAQLNLIQAIEATSSEHPWSSQQVADSQAHDTIIHTFSLDNEEDIVGYWILQQVLDELHLHNFTICKERQGRGIGTQILKTLISHLCGTPFSGLESLSENGAVKHVFLEVRESNLAAQAVYQKCGFEVVGMRNGYYPTSGKDRENAVLMRCIIPG